MKNKLSLEKRFTTARRNRIKNFIQKNLGDYFVGSVDFSHLVGSFVHVIFDVLKLSSNLESLLSYKYSAEKIPDQKDVIKKSFAGT